MATAKNTTTLIKMTLQAPKIAWKTNVHVFFFLSLCFCVLAQAAIVWMLFFPSVLFIYNSTNQKLAENAIEGLSLFFLNDKKTPLTFTSAHQLFILNSSVFSSLLFSSPSSSVSPCIFSTVTFFFLYLFSFFFGCLNFWHKFSSN